MNLASRSVLTAAVIITVGGVGYWLGTSRSTPQDFSNSLLNRIANPVKAVSELTCGSDGAVALALKVIKDNPPKDLIEAASVSNQEARWNDCSTKFSDTPTDPDAAPGTPASHCRAEVMRMQDDAKDTAVKAGTISYEIKNIRLEARDQTTGAVSCNATAAAMVPKLGNAEQEISYKLEKMEDGGVHIDMTGLH